MKYKCKLFPFGLLDGEAAEQWLNQQAAQGLALVKIMECGIAVFKEVDIPERYCITLWLPKNSVQDKENFQEFKELCRASGARLVATQGFYCIFALEEGAPPLETDIVPTVMAVKRALRGNIWLFPVLLGIVIFILSVSGMNHSYFLYLSRPFFLLLYLMVAVGAVYSVVYLVRYVRYSRAIRRSLNENSAPPALEMEQAYRRGLIFAVLSELLLLACLALMVWDGAQNFAHISTSLVMLANYVASRVGTAIRKYKRMPWRGGWVAIGASLVLVAGMIIFATINPIAAKTLEELGDIPVLRAAGLKEGDEPPMLDYAMTPLVQVYEIADNSDYEGLRAICADAANAFIANRIFYELQYPYSGIYSAKGKSDPSNYAPYDFPGADRALFNGKERFIIQKGLRVVYVQKHIHQEGTPEAADLFARIQQVYFG